MKRRLRHISLGGAGLLESHQRGRQPVGCGHRQGRQHHHHAHAQSQQLIHGVLADRFGLQGFRRGRQAQRHRQQGDQKSH